MGEDEGSAIPRAGAVNWQGAIGSVDWPTVLLTGFVTFVAALAGAWAGGVAAGRTAAVLGADLAREAETERAQRAAEAEAERREHERSLAVDRAELMALVAMLDAETRNHGSGYQQRVSKSRDALHTFIAAMRSGGSSASVE